MAALSGGLQRHNEWYKLGDSLSTKPIIVLHSVVTHKRDRSSCVKTEKELETLFDWQVINNHNNKRRAPKMEKSEKESSEDD